jgi:hypothetical protein
MSRALNFMRRGATFSVSGRELRGAGITFQQYLELIGGAWLTRYHATTDEYFLTHQ